MDCVHAKTSEPGYVKIKIWFLSFFLAKLQLKLENITSQIYFLTCKFIGVASLFFFIYIFIHF